MTSVPVPPSTFERPRVTPGALTDSTVLVVGGSSGFGRQVVVDAATAGARLIVVGRDAAKAHAVAHEASGVGGKATAFALDATTEDGLERLIEVAGDVDHVVSTLGGAMGGGFLEAPFDEIRAAVDDKVFDNLRLARALAPHLNDGGSMTFTAGTGGAPHTASGAYLGNQAIATMVRGLALELAPRGIRVNAVAPTWTATPLWRDHDEAEVRETQRQMAATIPLGRTGEVGEVAEAYLFLLTCGFITGQTIAVDGGMNLL
ncbi:SDR family NAD(P)-dependent oxidoreductase [Demequina lignilytica]|uniref:SDR family oxidoreductase n=1 Tax=Demequina lignilytica TaxID=3051663 RepID=A0AB35MEX4_9MICO|nr:SDR family oxidoreductase [Demequina sp. SYSU T0a273]MDN4482297.1 SDR family oxidoreductase [Demequina sp. SYSU T0a273]